MVKRNLKPLEVTTRVNYKCFEPPKSGTSHPNYLHEIATTQYEGKSKQDTVWFLMKTLSPTLSKDVPTWAAYNSLLSKKPTRTAAMMLPVTNGCPTNWDNLYTALKEADKLQESLLSIYSCISRLFSCRRRLISKVTLCFEWKSSM